ncbi:RagB/SusD family nutrient uptake outer membrane protein [Capnocytophaga canis]|uniref:RagB/SusD family nutrient uptake outer membrane protein n=1 Tax=Capnocytophaga canis TaxID=1848903 RepID=UPI0037D83491
MKKYFKHITIVSGALLIASCNDFLDREPLDKITPEVYFNNEADLASYSIKLYPEADFSTISPGQYGLSVFKSDNATDNQAASEGSTRWLPGEWRVGSSGGGWDFGTIRQCNYFFENVLPKYEAGKIQGNQANIKQYIGEMYVLRANIYFSKLQSFGDFPIITEVLPDKKDVLIEKSKRRPRNEVARFILSDLDKAISFLGESTPNGKNRLNINAAYLLKSRVALYEGTWLKYHKGTAQVPGGNGWPGASADYLKGFSIDIDSEIKFFLKQAKDAAQVVAEKMVNNLTKNSGERVARDKDLASKNDYYMMFADSNMEPYNEVIFWRKYSEGEGIRHNIQMELARNGGGSGYTKGLVESFLMKNGLPIYAAGSEYAGDDYLKDVIKDRDDRLGLFMKIDKDVVYYHEGKAVEAKLPEILNPAETRASTGYRVKKGMNYIERDAITHHVGVTGSLVFRGAEALLNYMEANYELDGSLDGFSQKYWKALRERANVDTDFNKTIAATDMEKEKLGDFGAHSAGNLVDKTLYNIRRERRNEFIAEGLRWMDLKRWRAMDQLKATPYIVEGFKIWGPMKEWYKKKDGTSALVVSDADSGNVNSESSSVYLRPYQRNKVNNLYFEGYKWNDAHYLNPLPMDAFRLTSLTEGNLETSVVYQNPGWSKVSGESLK